MLCFTPISKFVETLLSNFNSVLNKLKLHLRTVNKNVLLISLVKQHRVYKMNVVLSNYIEQVCALVPILITLDEFLS